MGMMGADEGTLQGYGTDRREGTPPGVLLWLWSRFRSRPSRRKTPQRHQIWSTLKARVCS